MPSTPSRTIFRGPTRLVATTTVPERHASSMTIPNGSTRLGMMKISALDIAASTALRSSRPTKLTLLAIPSSLARDSVADRSGPSPPMTRRRPDAVPPPRQHLGPEYPRRYRMVESVRTGSSVTSHDASQIYPHEASLRRINDFVNMSLVIHYCLTLKRNNEWDGCEQAESCHIGAIWTKTLDVQTSSLNSRTARRNDTRV